MSHATPERRPIEEVLREHTPRWMSIPGVAGCGVGRKGDEPCIVVFAASRTPELAAGIPGVVETYPVVIEETGPFRAL